jgi:antitoxin component YwqK of YwqJK toxin-antitoxin module
MLSSNFAVAEDAPGFTLPQDPTATPIADATGSDVPADQVELIQERYPNASIKIERQVTRDSNGNYINHGSWSAWDEAGRLSSKGEYRYNLPHGRWIRFVMPREGNLYSGPAFKGFEPPFVSEAGFSNGQLDGVWTITDAKDHRICEMTFEADVQTGPMRWYYTNGQKRGEATFKNGQMDGEMIDYGTDGRVVSKETYIEGRKLGTETDWHSPGVKKSEREFTYPVPRTTYDYFAGTVKTDGKVDPKAKLAHGHSTWWHKNGQKQLEGEYKNNVPVGKFTWWHSNGQKEAEGNYIEGVQDGSWTAWHVNGQKQWEGQYENGARVGKWPEWKTDGKIVIIEDFSSSVESTASTDNKVQVPDQGASSRQPLPVNSPVPTRR